MRFVLYRHGEIDLPSGGKRYTGITEYPLSERGKVQMEQAGANCVAIPDIVYCSSSLRCVQSARAFLEGMKRSAQGDKTPKLALRDDLREIHMGDWDGKTFEEIRRKFPEEYEARGRNLADYRAPGGETFLEVQKRSVNALLEIAQNEQEEAVVFTHLGVLRTLRCYFLSLPLSQMMEWTLAPGEHVLFCNKK